MVLIFFISYQLTDFWIFDNQDIVNQINKDATKIAYKLNIKDKLGKFNEKTHIFPLKTTNRILIPINKLGWPYEDRNRISCKKCNSKCNILTSDPAVDQGRGASSRRYQGITLTVDGLNWVQMLCSQEAGGRQTMI